MLLNKFILCSLIDFFSFGTEIKVTEPKIELKKNYKLQRPAKEIIIITKSVLQVHYFPNF